MSIGSTLKYALSGGRRRWFSRQCAKLTRRGEASAERSAPIAIRRLVEVLTVGLDVDPDRALQICGSWQQVLTEAGGSQSSQATVDSLLQRSLRVQSVAGWRVGWTVAKAADRRDLTQELGNRLAKQWAAEGDADTLIGHLDECRGKQTLDPQFLHDVVHEVLSRHTLDDNPAWRPFFRQLAANELPAIFDVHALLGRIEDVLALARTEQQVQTAVQLCLNEGTVPVLRQAVTLASGLQGPAGLREVHRALGTALRAVGDHAEALASFEASGDEAEQSVCHENLGNFMEALRLCPVTESQRFAGLAERNAKLALDASARGDVTASMIALMELRAFLADRGAGIPIYETWRGVIERHRAEVLRIGREILGARSDGAKQETRDGLLSRSAFEEAAGQWGEAAVLLERTGDVGDRLKASQLWEKDDRYGEAVRALGPLADRRDVQLRLAQLRERGGDAVGAARLFEHLNCWDDARRCYVTAGEPVAAANCYVNAHGRASAAQSLEYAELLGAAGCNDDLVQLYVEHLEGEPDNRVVRERLRALVERADKVLSPPLREAARRHLARGGDLDLRRKFDGAVARWITQARGEVLKRYGRIWGMDLGTSKSAVAVFNFDARAPEICSDGGKPHFASTLSIDGSGNELVGLDSLEQLRPDIRGCIEGAKRVIGSRTTYRIGDRRFSPEEVAARLLAHGRRLVETFLSARLKERVLELASRTLGESCPSEWLEHAAHQPQMTFSAPDAMVTVPAYFNFDQRRATRDAAEIAGVKLHRLVSEPTAACLSVALTRKRTGKILVVDLGAGTLDLSYIESSFDDGQGFFEVEQVWGDSRLGSRDFDDLVEGELAAQMDHSRHASLSGLDRKRLHAAAEQIKIALSGSQHATYDLVSFAGYDRHTFALSAKRFEELLRPRLQRLSEVCRDAAALAIDHLILVGAPMLSPLIRNHIEGIFRRKADAVVDPRTAVAMGAACQGAVLSDHDRMPMLLLDIAPFALGVLVQGGSPPRPSVSFHIPRGSRIPHLSSKPYTTTEDNQPRVTVQVFQGLGDSTEPAANSRVAAFHLEGLPPAKAGEPKIDIAFQIDANGVLEVTAKDEKSGRAQSVRIDDTTWLSPADRQRMTDRLVQTRRWDGARAEVSTMAAEVASLLDKLASIERQDGSSTWRRQFQSWQRLPSANFARFSSHDQTTLAEMYNLGPSMLDRVVVELDRARNLLPRGRRFLDAASAFSPGAAESDVEQQLQSLKAMGAQVRDLAKETLDSLHDKFARFEQWTATMSSCAALLTDPQDRLVACHGVGNWKGVIDAFEAVVGVDPRAEMPLPLLRRRLDSLARLNRREPYREALARCRDRLGLRDPNYDRLNEFVRHVRPAVAWVKVRDWGSGSGFLIAPNLVATNRHVVFDGDRPVASDRITVNVAGATRTVVATKGAANAAFDIALLELRESTDVPVLRVGYTNLTEVGERVLAIGFPVPEGDSFDENLLLDHGIVNRIRTQPEAGSRQLELGLRIFAGMSGGPIFNDCGEVIAISTFARYMSAGGPQGAVVDKSSHAIAVEALHDLIPHAW